MIKNFVKERIFKIKSRYLGNKKETELGHLKDG
jgi:hypothetical protein